jgi:hypothetical protein
MTTLLANFIVLFDPITNWVKKKDTEFRKYLLAFILTALLSTVAGFLLPVFNFPAFNAGTAICMTITFFGGIVSVLLGIMTVIELTDTSWWAKTVKNFELAKTDARKRRLRVEKEETATSVAKEDLEYLR